VVLAIPIRGPRVFGDELIYWEVSRAFAWTGQFTARGGTHVGLGVGYPTLISISHRLAGSERSAYLIARALGALMFSLAALPAHAIASRVLSRRSALVAAGLTVLVPSVVYTSAILTENAFYPAFLGSVLLMLRALERPTVTRQLVLVVGLVAAFLIRPQAIVLLPAYLFAAIVLQVIAPGRRRRAAVAAAFREQAATIATVTVVALGYLLATAARGRSPLLVLGRYHVLVSARAPLAASRWALANLGDLDLYVGIVPLAAFGVVLACAFTSTAMTAALRRLVVVSASVGLGMLATAAALSASKWGLGRVHERNLFYVTPLVLIVFLAWIDDGLPRPRRAVAVVAPVAALLPLAIPASAVRRSSEDGLALVWWRDLPFRPGFVVVAMAGFAAVVTVLFIRARRPDNLMRACIWVMIATLVGAEFLAIGDAFPYPAVAGNVSWIDRAVGPGGRVLAIWVPPKTAARKSARTHDLWTNELFNRSVRDVASLAGRLPDGLPVERLVLHTTGCLTGTVEGAPAFAVVEAGFPLAAPVVARSRSTGSVLYRLERQPGARCLAYARSG